MKLSYREEAKMAEEAMNMLIKPIEATNNAEGL